MYNLLKNNHCGERLLFWMAKFPQHKKNKAAYSRYMGMKSRVSAYHWEKKAEWPLERIEKTAAYFEISVQDFLGIDAVIPSPLEPLNMDARVRGLESRMRDLEEKVRQLAMQLK